jgi:hypothetical protein
MVEDGDDWKYPGWHTQVFIPEIVLSYLRSVEESHEIQFVELEHV